MLPEPSTTNAKSIAWQTKEQHARVIDAIDRIGKMMKNKKNKTKTRNLKKKKKVWKKTQLEEEIKEKTYSKKVK